MSEDTIVMLAVVTIGAVVLLLVAVRYYHTKAKEYKELSKVFKREYDKVSSENLTLKEQLKELQGK